MYFLSLLSKYLNHHKNYHINRILSQLYSLFWVWEMFYHYLFIGSDVLYCKALVYLSYMAIFVTFSSLFDLWFSVLFLKDWQFSGLNSRVRATTNFESTLVFLWNSRCPGEDYLFVADDLWSLMFRKIHTLMNITLLVYLHCCDFHGA